MEPQVINEKLKQKNPLWMLPFTSQRLADLESQKSFKNVLGIQLASDVQVSESAILSHILDSQLTHVCHEQNVNFEEELLTSALMLTNPNVFFEKPLTSIFSPDKVEQLDDSHFEIWSTSFHKISEKVDVISEIRRLIEERLGFQAIASDIGLIADELFTNAIFNAPYVDQKTYLNPGISRTDSSLAMPEPNRGRVFIGLEGKRLVVGVKDPFGTLNIEKLFKRIKNCHDNGVAENINTGPGGAGIGSYLVYRASTSYYAAVSEGEATILCCSIPLEMSGRKRQQLPKNIHCIHGTGR